MGVKYSVELHPLVITYDIPRLDSPWRKTIRDAIREKLGTHPELFGKPLRNILKGCRTLRVGDWRVVFTIKQQTVYVVAIIHRSSDYKEVKKRLTGDKENKKR